MTATIRSNVTILRSLVTLPPLKITPLTYALLDGLGYLKMLAPPEKILRWIEGKLNLLGRLPYYVSIDQKTYGRYGVLPTTSVSSGPGEGTAATYLGSTQRLGP